ncbi:MAG: Asp-tRNA(Asn)/Glu-tRNA(Gln) amidotransferase subunit GatB, partial [Planctomycetes bacterium]|nr:Asp-tRNA(Asn)/Glu-tRNA(Gln) amidotransferase subunit GatB [Planctomycetota bacterium]
GVLPVMNKQAYEYSVLTAMALDCRIPTFTKWDRKSYYYPDLPKNYQISQYDLPLGENGFIEIPLESGRTKRIGITRAHLEEDAGKNLHTAGNFSQVDLNRTGTPLLEIVTEPDMNSGAEVRALAVELQRMVRFLGVSEADMQKGHMRFEPNINLAILKDGVEYRTSIVEIKNLNSFRALERSVNHEEHRQLDEFLDTGKVMKMGSKTTRGWDDEREVTVLQREKEEAHDYRYFPEPDLMPVKLAPRWLDDIRSHMCELPLKRQMRYVEQYKLSDYDAGVLTAERSTADFFDEAVEAGGEPKRVCNILAQTGLRKANEKGCSIAQLGVQAIDVAKLAQEIETGRINASSAKTIFEEIVKLKANVFSRATVEDPLTVQRIAEQLNLIQKSDAGELEAIVDQIIAENPKAVEDVTSGGKKSKKAKGFLLGQVMQKTKGQANPKVVSEILAKKLG